MRIAIVEDNENVREALKLYLELENFQVSEFAGIKGFEREASSFDLLILDVMLPDGDGFQLAKRLRAASDIPIIFLTARTAESDRITGFELGADDYIQKPFSPKEAVLRVKAVLKRQGQKQQRHAVSFSLSGEQLSIDEERHEVLLNGASVQLTMAEWKILLYLSSNAPQVFSRMQILSNSLDYLAEGSERTVDTHIKNLRQKLGSGDWIETIRGLGYRFSGNSQ
jgi:DNA-binding response OmpR family regulator